MKRDRNKVGLFLTLSMFLLLLLTACSQSSTAKVETPKTSSSIKTVTTESQTLTIVNATAKQDGQMIVVDTTMKNSIASAQVIKPDLFALTVNSTVLSPDASKSQIPEQIPANTTAQFNLEFNSNNLEGNDSLRLGYQPINQSDPEQFFAIGDLTISKVASLPTSNGNTSSQVQSNTNNQSSSKATQMSTSQQSTSSVTGQIELQTQSIDGPVKVLVPVGWIKSPYTGGDFGGYKFVNPNDGNEQMLVVYSACAGCGYANGDPQHDKPDPVSLIAEDPVSKFTFNNGLSAGYTYYAEGDPYTGNGVVTVKPQGGGYAQVDIILPDSDKSIATKVLNSFQFFGF